MTDAIVLVCGDVGHSPRMSYHVSSLTTRGIRVQYVGYQESTPNKQVINDPLVTIVPIPPPPTSLSKLPSLLSLFLKLIWICTTLQFTLFFRTKFRTSLILVQNPPGVPVLLFAWLASKLKGAAFAIDWHNYTSSVISYNYGLDNTSELTLYQKLLCFVSSFCAAFEGFFGRQATFNFCVSNAMKQNLKKRWNVEAITHYDRPASWKFRYLNIEDKHEFYNKLSKHVQFTTLLSQSPIALETISESTVFSYRDIDGKAQLRADRPLLLMSSTSWTKDEDFGILLDALRLYDKLPERHSLALPRLFVIITGKGPMKAEYLRIINSIQWSSVTILTPWLEAEDYPLMLGCADLGVSLHASTSGLDLPMKVVDMLGCGVPVLAKNFQAIDELVKPSNGCLFNNAEELCNLLVELSSGFPGNSQKLNDLKRTVRIDAIGNWEDHWISTCWPVISGYMQSKHRKLN